MKQTINLYQFRDAFRDYDRLDNFSYEGLEILFESLESFAEDTGTEMELDVIGLCCEFSEGVPEDIAGLYSIDLSDANGDELEERTIVTDYLQDNTLYMGETSKGTLVYQDF